MCLIAFALQASERWPLVIAANRDEFLARPTQPLGWWTSDAGQPILSGRDLQAGGTWLGMTPQGRVAFLTNVREAKMLPAPRSRGELVTRWLESRVDARAFLDQLQAEAQNYAGFNLVVGDFQSSSWTWASNRRSQSNAAPAWQMRSLAPGIYGLSNAQLDTPWPKTRQLKQVLTQTLAHAAREDFDTLHPPLWEALANRVRAPAALLPSTGVPTAFEAALSSAFVDFAEHGYGTRSSTLLVAGEKKHAGNDTYWNVEMKEKTFPASPRPPEPEHWECLQTVWRVEP